jgi:enterochelin esterase-like enzyme
MRPHTLASRIVLVGTCSLAAAGWLGVRVGADPTVPAISAAALGQAADTDVQGVQTGIPGVRDRSAWQPSPIPGKTGTNVTTNTPSQPAQPAPALPAIGQVGIGGAALAAQPAAQSAAQPATGAASDPDLAAPTGELYTPLSEMFTTDRLEALYAGGLPAQRGQWVQQTFSSKALGRQDTYMVWLPPGYNPSAATRYPSLYLLHGVGGPSGYGVDEWLGYALTEDLDRIMALNLIQPMIVVLPNGEQGYWMNHAPGTDGTKWADYVATDLVKDVDSHFRTDPKREKRAIGGLSMGGAGSLQIALNHPDTFSVVGAHSPTIRPFETSPEFFGDQKWFAKYDPISLAKNTDAAAKLAIWIDVGYDDPWRPMASQLEQILAAKKTPAQFHVLEGEHEGWYWAYYLPEYLNFYSTNLNAPAKTAKGAPLATTHPLATIASALQPAAS